MTWDTIDWDDPTLRLALARRDVSTVYTLLVDRWQVPQQHIARATRQTQSEVSEIICGRQVQSYRLLARIADGSECPAAGWDLNTMG